MKLSVIMSGIIPVKLPRCLEALPVNLPAVFLLNE
jgi:hypothetical protein